MPGTLHTPPFRIFNLPWKQLTQPLLHRQENQGSEGNRYLVCNKRRSEDSNQVQPMGALGRKGKEGAESCWGISSCSLFVLVFQWMTLMTTMVQAPLLWL